MAEYRMMPHGYYGTWWKTQKKFLGIWVTIDSYRDFKEAKDILKFMKLQEEQDA